MNYGILVTEMVKEGESVLAVLRNAVCVILSPEEVSVECVRTIHTGVNPDLDDIIKTENRERLFAHLEDDFYVSFTHNNRNVIL